jgi:hypothetical protein
MPLNVSVTNSPLARPPGRNPIYVLQLICNLKTGETRWMPTSIYPTSVANSFLQIQLPELHIDACSFAHCQDSKVS